MYNLAFASIIFGYFNYSVLSFILHTLLSSLSIVFWEIPEIKQDFIKNNLSTKKYQITGLLVSLLIVMFLNILNAFETHTYDNLKKIFYPKEWHIEVKILTFLENQLEKINLK